MSPVLARYYEFDPLVRWLAFALIAAVVALALGVYSWFPSGTTVSGMTA